MTFLTMHSLSLILILMLLLSTMGTSRGTELKHVKTQTRAINGVYESKPYKLKNK
jgi:hypothetical protein